MKRLGDNYHEAYNSAVTYARQCNCTVQLRRTKEYGRYGYTLSLAVGEGHRYGSDAEGEFIKPNDPIVGVSVQS